MATGKTSSDLVPTSKVVTKLANQTIRSTVATTSQPSTRGQTTVTSTSRRNCGGSAPKNVVQSRKSSLHSTSSSASVGASSGQRGLKLRPSNPTVLPVLCVYSDKNQLVRKEQFRTPRPTSLAQTKPRIRNNENLLAPRPSVPRSSSSHNPIANTTQPSMAVHLKSTISSTARAGNSSHINNNHNNAAKRSRMTALRCTATKVQLPAPSNKGKLSIYELLLLLLLFFVSIFTKSM